MCQGVWGEGAQMCEGSAPMWAPPLSPRVGPRCFPRNGLAVRAKKSAKKTPPATARARRAAVGGVCVVVVGRRVPLVALPRARSPSPATGASATIDRHLAEGRSWAPVSRTEWHHKTCSVRICLTQSAGASRGACRQWPACHPPCLPPLATPAASAQVTVTVSRGAKKRAKERRPAARRTPPHTCVRERVAARAGRSRFCVLLCVPEHEIQAVRFSASGRKCPSSHSQRLRHTAYASPCMFSRLERDVGICCCLSTRLDPLSCSEIACDHVIYLAPTRPAEPTVF